MLDSKKSEEEVLEFWKENNIYDKIKKKNSSGRKFYFMDGPPYASGHIHMGTALNKILKDIAMRSRRSQGYDVFDRPGYDTHGLPIEFQVEKEIGSKSKDDIEKYGIKNFVEKCKEYATKYIDVMNDEFANMGVWMDWSNPYLTMNDEYVEAIWDTLKSAYEKDLLYLGSYPVHLCPRCETAVAFNEIEYEKQEDNAIFVKFPLKKKKDSYLIIWTTTPWTLPANTGIMVNPDFEYQEVEVSNGEKWIIAKELVPDLMMKSERGYTVLGEFKGKEMEGWEYENPLSKNLNMNLKNAYRVVLSARYVSIEDGSGLVHCAPGHGKEDYEVGKENGLDSPSPVNLNGSLSEEAGKYAGKKARVVDEEIIKDLEADGFLVYRHKYSHDYPKCWRCKTSLLMVSQPQWFLKISGIHKKLIEQNQKTSWVPDWAKLRMKAWLEGISDWPISRERYWGTPLPIWICDSCNEQKFIGTLAELKKESGKENIDVHRPEIDEVEIECSCGGKMRRVSSVLDVWFDSGVSSWAALGYPSSKDKFKRYWPADLNIEGTDQFRGWWNSQIILSEIKFDKKPFESISVHGMVLDLGKKKMSKSLGNIIAPKDVVDKFGRDYLRYYFAKYSKGENFSYDESDFRDIQSFFRIILNVNAFVNQLEKKKSKIAVEDKWILSRYSRMVKETIESFNKYKFYEAVNRIEDFVIRDLSRTYIQIVRDRADETYEVLNEMRIGVIKLLSAISPFVSETIWQNLKRDKTVDEESVHLSSWPKVEEKKIDDKLEEEFSTALQIIEKGLAERDNKKIGLRWPLAEASYTSPRKLSKAVEAIISQQLNVKSINGRLIEGSAGIEVSLDTDMTSELEAEGFSRELSRRVQAERKKLGLKKEDVVILKISADKELREMFESQKELIMERTNSRQLDFVDEKSSKNFVDFQIKEKSVSILIS